MAEPRSDSQRDKAGTFKGKTLVIGLGNPIVSDDSVGLRVVQQLETLLADRDNLDVSEDYWGGLRLMERMIGYDRVIVIDAICTGAKPGTIHHLALDSVPTQKSASAHDVNLPTAIAFGRHAGAHLPDDEEIRIVGIEAEDVINISDRCTPAVEAAIPRAVDAVIKMLGFGSCLPRHPPGSPTWLDQSTGHRQAGPRRDGH
ncbi:MAG: hydrogenase maturation protease [Pirellulales bacterium]|nr:hydrogenase maturation protease [Pirellulales bacterium]